MAIKLRTLPEIDGLRFIAITFVVLHHQFFQQNGLLTWFYHHGWIGVDIFFTLSGYLITSILLSEYQQTQNIDFKRFWLRRMFRLWPSWFITLMISFAAIWKVTQHNPEAHQLLEKYWWHYFLHMGNYSHAFFGKLHTFTSHYWSLAVEEHFYFMWPPILYFALKKKWNIGLVFTILLTLPYLFRVLHHALGMPNETITLSTHTRLDSLAWGCLLAFYLRPLHDQKEIKWSQELIFILGAILLIAIAGPMKLSNLNPWIKELNRVFIAWATCLLIIVCIKGRPRGLRAFLGSRQLAKLGLLSYGVYLIHFLTNAFTFSFLAKKFNIVDQNILAVINLSLPYIPAYLMYRFIDGPFMNWRSRLIP